MVGCAIHDLFSAARTTCWFPYYQRAYIVNADTVTPISGSPGANADNPGLVDASICIYSSARALWAPTLRRTRIAIQVGGQNLSSEQVALVRARVLADATAEGATLASEHPTLLTADLVTSTVLWQGHAHNLVSAASLVTWVVSGFSLVRAARRARARGRHECQTCGYDLSGLSGLTRCPECGTNQGG